MGNVDCDIGAVSFVPVLRTDVSEPLGLGGKGVVDGMSIFSESWAENFAFQKRY